ncbi:hypothetical protein NL676_032324 [Syzygium grande]|nr:hypothetical protein NL676_032324 [Syzygium grande]
MEADDLSSAHYLPGVHTGWSISICVIVSWIIIYRWNQRNKVGPKTWPLVGAAVEQFMNYERMHDWLVEKRKAEVEAAHESREDAKMKHDILSRFIELGNDPESNVTDKSLRDIVLNFVIAGRDTTATTLSWSIFMIMTHQNIAEKIYSELENLERDQAREEEVSLLPYTVDDPESFNRRVSQFAKLLTYDSLGKLHYLHAAGPRICLGKDSAYLQMKMALAILCRFYEFKLVPNHPVEYRMMTILSMKHGLRLTIARRP